MFTKETLIDLLNELTGAQESIEKVSVWIQQYRDQAPVIAQTWKTSFIEGLYFFFVKSVAYMMQVSDFNNTLSSAR